ncbi:hypothetical protein K432DRAFT_434145 [Lepidopterella palustris CBS 459.81]|uniref:Rhodopsin domain-containing protein n=1 Tax=Lepidopterella palustris CBS 459.81 TaxID=1314670 RepID=A0A8E2JGA7_9PEZI|nr:hypothetical protein K432DRAFT_434145 [Lepidopterella palustris CBS 459.81]
MTSTNQSAAPVLYSHPRDSTDDHRSLVNVVGWFLLVVVIMIILTRLGSRWAKLRSLGLDDVFIIISTVFAISQTVTVSIGVGNGLGHINADVTEEQRERQQKSIFAFTVLFIMGQFFAKLSIIAFIVAITPHQTHRKMAFWLVAVICLWMVSSILGFAFQCELPETWKFENRQCVNRKAFYTFVEVFNILIDNALALFPSAIIYGLQLQLKPKVITISFFMSRILVVVASIAQLITIYSRTEDPFLSWTFALLVIIIQTLGIITACGPYLKPFLESMNSGMIGNHDIQRRLGSTLDNSYGSSGSHGLKKYGKFGESLITDSSKSGTVNELSQSSRARIIRQTTTYRVSSEIVQ